MGMRTTEIAPRDKTRVRSEATSRESNNRGYADLPGIASAFTGGLLMAMIPTSPLTARETGALETRLDMLSADSMGCQARRNVIDETGAASAKGRNEIEASAGRFFRKQRFWDFLESY